MWTTKLKLLKEYKKTFERRACLEGIDRTKIMNHVKELIRKEKS